MRAWTKWVGASAGVGVMATAMLLAAPSGATAADGDPLVAGAWNTTTLGTAITHTSSDSPWTLFINRGLFTDFLDVEGTRARDSVSITSDYTHRALSVDSGNDQATLYSLNRKNG